MNNIYILGFGGLAREVCFLIEEINRNCKQWNIMGFVSKDKTDVGIQVGKYSIICCENELSVLTDIHVAIGFGSPAISNKVVSYLKQKNPNINFPNLIHPNVTGDWDNIKINEGNIICSGCSLTTDITIGSFNLLNLNVTIGHDSNIQDYNVINPSANISGAVTLEGQSLIGTGTQILQNIFIKSCAVIGAGSVVTKSIRESGVYVGVPAKKIKEID